MVAKGYVQQHRIDYIEVFVPVARLDTICLVIALAAQKKWTFYQLDVKSTREDLGGQAEKGIIWT